MIGRPRVSHSQIVRPALQGICAFCFAVLFVLRSLGPASSGSLDLSHYRLTFDERFTSLNISASSSSWNANTRWIAHTPWNGDFGDAVFDNPGPDGPFSLTASGLRITARKDASGRWHSGLVCSVDRDGAGQRGFAQQFGYFEMKAKLPSGPGVWPAFWLVGVNKKSGSSEIDVLEYYGVGPEYYHNVVHLFKDGKDLLSKDNKVKVPRESLTDRYNTFGVLIESDKTTFYLNRNEVWQIDTPPEYHQPMYVLANLALGGGWPIEFTSPVAMDIAYIKVFQAKSRDSVN
jgi:beta-glucanase (GH16 family)